MSVERPRILIVDDMPENIDILMSVLQERYAIVAARDGEKALAMARGENRPDLILLDVMMPGLDGYQVCAALKADAATADIPVIFITALDGAKNEAMGLALGAVDYVSKPFVPEVVRARVANHIELKHHRDRLQELVGERTRELTLTQEATIYTLANLAETRDPETGGHIRRTQTYVKLLAEALCDLPHYSSVLDAPTIELLYKSAPLHDIGKVGVPDAILLKPGRLTQEEFEVIKLHTEHGRRALSTAAERLGESSFLRYAVEIAWTHHEKWDGSGYPRGLSGEAIPLSGRLMAIADVYDALISKRPYKRPFTHAEAAAHIVAARGTHFDPQMVDAFSEIHDAFRRTALEFADFDEEREKLSAS